MPKPSQTCPEFDLPTGGPLFIYSILGEKVSHYQVLQDAYGSRHGCLRGHALL
jgi:hypothetical protein